MKVMILAFDGLEYELVEKFNLKNLKQIEYGKVRIPKECFLEVKALNLKNIIMNLTYPGCGFPF